MTSATVVPSTESGKKRFLACLLPLPLLAIVGAASAVVVAVGAASGAVAVVVVVPVAVGNSLKVVLKTQRL